MGGRLVSQESGYGRRRAGGVREQSLLDEMRAAVRGDRQRAEQRRARDPEPVAEAPTQAEPPEAEPEHTEPPPPDEAGFFRRITRRSPST